MAHILSWHQCVEESYWAMCLTGLLIGEKYTMIHFKSAFDLTDWRSFLNSIIVEVKLRTFAL